MAIVGVLGLGRVVDTAIRNSTPDIRDSRVIKEFKDLLEYVKSEKSVADYSSTIINILDTYYSSTDNNRLYKQVMLLVRTS